MVPYGLTNCVIFFHQSQIWKTQKNVSCLALKTVDLFDKYSSFIKLQRVVGHILRFINNCRSKNTKLLGALSPDELNKSLLLLVKLVLFKFKVVVY